MKTWMTALTAFALLASPLAAQEEEPAVAKSEGMSFSVGAGYALWIAPFDFEASGPAISYERSSGMIDGFNLSGRLDFNETWGVQADADLFFSTDLDATVVGLGGVYRPGLLDDPWDTHLRASILYGMLNDDVAPGDFDPGIGFEVAAGVDYSLGEMLLEGLSARADLAGRLLEFEFDADSDITSDDGEMGGFGLRILLGLEYRF